RVRFAVGRYDPNRPLVIDPALVWTTYFGSPTASDGGEGIALDSSGNIYIAGTTVGPTGFGDGFFSKITPDGTTAIFTQIMGGRYDSYCHALAIDAGGNIYLGGETDSPDFPATFAVTPYPGYNGDAFVVKLDSTGKRLVWGGFLGGSG